MPRTHTQIPALRSASRRPHPHRPEPVPAPPHPPRHPPAGPARQATQQWKDRYKIRAGVKGTIRQATHVTGVRTARYLGLAQTRLEHNAAAAAINLIRLDAWWTSRPLDRTRTSHLQRLNLPPATSAQ